MALNINISGNSNAAMMRDPNLANSRVYVGNLAETITTAELMLQFSKYGTIRGITVNRGFGFIQFLNTASATNAIMQENGVFYQGRKMTVRPAMKNGPKSDNNSNNGTGPKNAQNPNPVAANPAFGADAQNPPLNRKQIRAKKQRARFELLQQQKQQIQQQYALAQQQQNSQADMQPDDDNDDDPNELISASEKQHLQAIQDSSPSNAQEMTEIPLLQPQQMQQNQQQQQMQQQQQQKHHQQQQNKPQQQIPLPNHKNMQQAQQIMQQQPQQQQQLNQQQQQQQLNQQQQQQQLNQQQQQQQLNQQQNLQQNHQLQQKQLQNMQQQQNYQQLQQQNVQHQNHQQQQNLQQHLQQQQLHQQQQPKQLPEPQQQQQQSITSVVPLASQSPTPNSNKPIAPVQQPIDPTTPQDLNRTARPYQQQQQRKRPRTGKMTFQQHHDFAGPPDSHSAIGDAHPQQFWPGDAGASYSATDYDAPGSAPKLFARMGPQQMPMQQPVGNMDPSPVGGGQFFRRRQPQVFQAGAYGSNVTGNDVEIIVTNPMLSQYADSVMARMRQFSLRVDKMFPNEESPLGHVLQACVARRTLYAVRLLPQNEQFRTINVFVLHSGDPNEHRNIPVDDALEMIENDLAALPAHIRRGPPAASGSLPTAVSITPTSAATAPPLNQRHPDGIQTLVNLIADNRPVTVLQYDRVIAYLQQRRELQLKAEIGDTDPVPAPPPPVVIDPELELQRKIMDIMNKPSITTSGAGGPAQPAPAQPEPAATVPNGMPAISPHTLNILKSLSGKVPVAAASPVTPVQSSLLADPKVQKALDSLLSGSLFKF